MNIRYIMRMRLDLFDGEGGAPAAAPAAAEGAATPSGAPAIPGKKPGKFDNVIFGKQPKAETPAETPPAAESAKAPATEETKEAREKRFRELISGEFKDEFAAENNRIFKQRWEEMKGVRQRAETAEAKVKEMQAAVDLMKARYGITDGNMTALQKAITDDIDMWNRAGAKEGLTGEQKRTLTMSQMRVSQLEEAEKSRLGSERAQRQLSKWNAEAVQLVEKYPGFDLWKESENPSFVGMLQAGVPMEHAYKVIHMDDIIADAIRTTQSTVEKQVTDSVRARGSRPMENGTAAQSAAIVKSDPSKMSKEELFEVARRVRRGEHIEF